MSIFKRILNFSQEAVANSDKRVAPRHPVGQAFPVKAVISLVGHDDDGHPLPDRVKRQDWAGRLVNISATGASMQIHQAAMGHRGEPCSLRLSIDQSHLEIPATIAQFRVYRDYALCGFSLHFPDFETKKAYLQLLEPVAFGATLSPQDSKKVRQDTPGLRKEEFRGEASSMLAVWREPGRGTVHGFDFRMNSYGVRWSEGMPELETYGLPVGENAGNTRIHRLTQAQQEEVRWLFCLAVPNLAKSVPADTRRFLTQVVA
jgi:hypothetical protein